MRRVWREECLGQIVEWVCLFMEMVFKVEIAPILFLPRLKRGCTQLEGRGWLSA